MQPDLTDDYLERLAQYAEQATAGVWWRAAASGRVMTTATDPPPRQLSDRRWSFGTTGVAHGMTEADAQYVAYAQPSVVLDLVQELLKLRAGGTDTSQSTLQT